MHNQAMRAPADRLVILVWAACHVFAVRTYSQTQEETLSGPDSHEKPQAAYGHLLGDWDGLRSDLLDRGVRFDFQYISDSLANVAGDRDDRFVAWNRVRGTVDVDFGALIGLDSSSEKETLWSGCTLDSGVDHQR